MKTYNNKTEYIRDSHKSNFMVISNNLVNDSRLNVIDIGIMTKLLSNSNTYIFNSEYFLKNISGINKKLYRDSIKKLQSLGYLQKKRIQDGVIWSIIEVPNSVTADFVSYELVSNEIVTTQIEPIINTNIEQILIETNNKENKENFESLDNTKDLDIIDSSNKFNIFNLDNEKNNQLKNKYKEIKLLYYQNIGFTMLDFEKLLSKIVVTKYQVSNDRISIKKFISDQVQYKTDFFNDMKYIIEDFNKNNVSA
jgi:hypothetical protein